MQGLIAVFAGAGSYVITYHLHEYSGARFYAMAALAISLSFVYLSLVVRGAREPQL